MKYAIIAAGEGSRLQKEGITKPKPLVCLGGKPLIDRLLRVFMNNGATGIAVICNDMTEQVGTHLALLKCNGLDGMKLPLDFIVKSTPSSMHSFYELSPLLQGDMFCLTTVDTVFDEKEFTEYISAFKTAIAQGYDGLMGVTDFIDDEKPLFVDTDDEMNITGFCDTPNGAKYISGGIYGLTDKSLSVLGECIARGESRMRNFQRALVDCGFRLKAYAFKMVFDIDHVEDIDKAQKYILGE